MNVCGNNIYSRSAEFVFLLSFTEDYRSNQNGGVFWNIWRIPTRDGDNMQNGHGASFPINLPAQFIKQHSDELDRIFDPFLGSGTTLIAADQLNRTCYGMELEPKYCQVILERYQNHCNKVGKPFECKINGTPFINPPKTVGNEKENRPTAL
jgi:DNA modification methylase